MYSSDLTQLKTYYSKSSKYNSSLLKKLLENSEDMDYISLIISDLEENKITDISFKSIFESIGEYEISELKQELGDDNFIKFITQLWFLINPRTQRIRHEGYIETKTASLYWNIDLETLEEFKDTRTYSILKLYENITLNYDHRQMSSINLMFQELIWGHNKIISFKPHGKIGRQLKYFCHHLKKNRVFNFKSKRETPRKW